MKTALFFAALCLSTSAFASGNSQTAADIVTLMQNTEVSAYLASNGSGNFLSVEASASNRCPAAPGIYSVMSEQYTNSGVLSCRLLVQVGTCASAADHSTVTLLGGQTCEKK